LTPYNFSNSTQNLIHFEGQSAKFTDELWHQERA
jgi:hypothetical protein